MPNSFLSLYTETPLRIDGKRVGNQRLLLKKNGHPYIPASFIEKAVSLPDGSLKDAALFLLPVRSFIGFVFYAASYDALTSLRPLSFSAERFDIAEDEALICADAPTLNGDFFLSTTRLKVRKDAVWDEFCSEVAKNFLPADERFSSQRDAVAKKTILVHPRLFDYLLLRFLHLTPRLTQDGRIEHEETVPETSLFLSPLDGASLPDTFTGECGGVKLVRIGAGKATGYGYCRLHCYRGTTDG